MLGMFCVMLYAGTEPRPPPARGCKHDDKQPNGVHSLGYETPLPQFTFSEKRVCWGRNVRTLTVFAVYILQRNSCFVFERHLNLIEPLHLFTDK